MKYLFYIYIGCLFIFIGFFIYKNKQQITPKQDYTLDVFTDTVYNYVIITTIVNNGNNIGVNSIMVDDTIK